MTKARKSNQDKGNAEAARTILADPEKYGGEQSAQVQWARLWMERNCKEEECES